MPGIERLSIDEIEKEAMQLSLLGVPAIAIFPFTEPDLKDDRGSEAVNPNGLVPRAVAAVKSVSPRSGHRDGCCS